MDEEPVSTTITVPITIALRVVSPTAFAHADPALPEEVFLLRLARSLRWLDMDNLSTAYREVLPSVRVAGHSRLIHQLNEMLSWCLDNLGGCFGVEEATDYSDDDWSSSDQIWYFTEFKDAIHFKLRWVGT